MNIAGMQVYFASDLKKFGITEDGHAFIGEVFFVEVENARGDRWRFKTYFNGVKVLHEEDGTMFEDKRPEATETCEKLVARIKAAGTINLEHWNEARAAYGSAAYLDYGQAAEVALEKLEG